MVFGFFTPGPMELGIIVVIGVLLFGTRIPKIARSIGSSIIEFKRGLSGIKEGFDEIDQEVRKSPSTTARDSEK